jgi:hypothetical protein
VSGVEINLSDDGETGVIEVAIQGIDREGVEQLRMLADEIESTLATEEDS